VRERAEQGPDQGEPGRSGEQRDRTFDGREARGSNDRIEHAEARAEQASLAVERPDDEHLGGLFERRGEQEHGHQRASDARDVDVEVEAREAEQQAFEVGHDRADDRSGCAHGRDGSDDVTEDRARQAIRQGEAQAEREHDQAKRERQARHRLRNASRRRR
jgi:hypothetical protein